MLFCCTLINYHQRYDASKMILKGHSLQITELETLRSKLKLKTPGDQEVFLLFYLRLKSMIDSFIINKQWETFIMKNLEDMNHIYFLHWCSFVNGCSLTALEDEVTPMTSGKDNCIIS